ncbi:MAG: flippase-like domain-containing protein [Saprospiraceae bacterium]|nr:flippase-like domain-containing protein [Saprospiraceae bacterium]
MKVHQGSDFFKVILSMAVLLGLAYFLHGVIQNADSWAKMARHLGQMISWDSSILLGLCLLLMPLNWMLEAMKWERLIRPIQVLSFRQSLKGVLSGVSVSILTPSRVGEYLGRVVSLEPSQRWQGVSAQALGSLLQLLILFLSGAWGMQFLMHHHGLLAPVSLEQLVLLALFHLVALSLLSRRSTLFRLLNRIPSPFQLNKVEKLLRFMDGYSRRSLSWVVTLTVFRICIYLIQYLLLLSFFGIDVDLVVASSAVLTTYLFQSVLPVPMLIGLIARGEITLLVWKLFEVNELAVLSSSYLLWVINVLLPALVGGVLIGSDASKIFKER